MKSLRIVASALALVAFAPAASAAVLIDFNNVNTDENVLFASSTSVATPTLVAATNQSHTLVTFANALGLLANASGQSSTTNADGTLKGLTSVTIEDGFTFAAASFNIPGIQGNPPPAEATTVFVEALFGNSVIGSATLDLDGNGENRIRIVGDAGEIFTSFRFTLAPADAGVNALEQVRLGGIEAVVPEPATWALMIGGFGLAGVAARRRRRPTVTFA